MLYNYLILNERDSHEIPSWEDKENYYNCEDVDALVSSKGLFASIRNFFGK